MMIRFCLLEMNISLSQEIFLNGVELILIGFAIFRI
nr:MAG TPA: hypothetical protein [Caudoviricetes sp.]